MSRKLCSFDVKWSPFNEGEKKNNMCEIAYQILQYVIYTLASLAVIFLPLTIAIPALLRKLPFYRDATCALDMLYGLNEEQEFSHIREGTIKLQAGSVKRGQRGFKQLLESIEANCPIASGKANKLTLVYGDIPELDEGIALSPNYALLLDDDLAKRVIYLPLSTNPSDIKILLIAWIKDRTQVILAAFTAIAAVCWALVGAWIWFG
jgi:hypothetical protein